MQVLYVYILFLFVMFRQCTSNIVGRTNDITTRFNDGFYVKSKLIGLFLGLENRGNRLWMHRKNGLKNSRQINVDSSTGTTICKSSRRVVPVRIIDIKTVSEKPSFILYEILVEVEGAYNSANPVVHSLPLSVRKDVDNPMNKQHEIFHVGFEGYLVCVNAEEQAILVPNKVKQVQFLPPTWRVRVKIDLHVEPLAPFGRIYRFTILDDVRILDDGSKKFDMVLDGHSPASMYYLSLAIDKQKKGKFCVLSKTEFNKKALLHCDHWKLGVNSSIYKIILPTAIAGSLLDIYYANKTKPGNIKTVDIVDKKSSSHETYLIEEPKDNFFKQPATSSDLLKYRHSQYIFGNGIVFLKYILPISLWLALTWNVISVTEFSDVLIVMNKQFKEAPSAYYWSLSQQPNIS